MLDGASAAHITSSFFVIFCEFQFNFLLHAKFYKRRGTTEDRGQTREDRRETRLGQKTRASIRTRMVIMHALCGSATVSTA